MRRTILTLFIFICVFTKAQTSYTICAGSPITLTATNPANLSNTIYSISPGTGTFISNVFVVSPTITTTYTLYTGGLTAGNTPSFTTSQATVNVYPFSQFFYSVSGTPTIGCSSNSVAVVVLGINNATSMTYTFNGPVGAPQPSFTASSNSLTVYFTTVGTWTTTVLQPSTGCSTKLALSVVSNTVPPPLNLNIPTTVINCTNSPIVLALQASSLNLTATWQSPTTISSGPMVQIPGVSPNSNTFVTTYTLTLRDNDNLCETQTVIPVYQNKALPVITIDPPQKLLTCAQPSIVLINQSTSGSAPGFPANLPIVITAVSGPTITTNPGPTFPVSVAGIYTITIKDNNNGCTETGTVEVVSAQNYPIFQSPEPVYNLCAQTSITLAPILTNGPASFQWTFPPGASSQVQTNGSIVVVLPGVYSVTATNSVGCSTTDFFNVVYCVALEETELNEAIELSPNPVLSFLELQFPSLGGTWRIYSLGGKAMLEGIAEESPKIISTENLDEGLYIFSFSKKDGTELRSKFIKLN